MYTMVRKFLAQALVVLGIAFLVVAVAACSQPAFAADGLPEGTTTTTQSTPATSETTSGATLQPASMSNSHLPADPKNVPLPDHAKKLGTAYVVAENGKKAVLWKYTVDDTTTDTLLSFYKSNMPSHGWTYANESRTGRYGGQVLKYTQGDRTCYVEVAASRALPGNGTLYITVTN
jgi:hypothetical protein